jgi:transcriptional regulator with XRE-family HTH domain
MNATLRSLVDERGLRQDWLAAQLGVSEASMSKWLRGVARLPITQVGPLAEVFGVSAETIVTAAVRTRETVENL